MTSFINSKGKALFFLIIGIVLLNVIACNSGSDDAKTSMTDTASKMADTTKATVKVKKGKASAMMAVDSKLKIEKDKDGIYSRSETMPEYPGGDAALSKYVEDNITYPQDALDQSKEATVKVSFIVDEKGMVTNPMVVGANAGNGLDEEATRVLKGMPAWKPGTVKGKNVKTRLELPITFKLSPDS
jgi:protein TonB